MSNLTARVTGDLSEVITNPHSLYEGDLRHYARIIFAAPNIHHGYHGLRHMLHVTWVCYQACDYYDLLGKMNSRAQRNLLIAALFHDYGHVGRPGDDADNISCAVSGMRRALLGEDADWVDEIAGIIQATQYPHVDLGLAETLEQSIIRDADITQSFSPAWIGQIAAGFGSELGRTPKEMLELQLKFLRGVHFSSDFGRVFFGVKAITAKITETEALLEILTS